MTVPDIAMSPCGLPAELAGTSSRPSRHDKRAEGAISFKRLFEA